MKFIRVFLWSLVAAMTLQGILHANEYGSAVSFFGGVSLTLSIWKENVWSNVRAFVPGISATNDEGLPRALVVSALQESTRHPGLHTLPTLRRALGDHRRSWDAFREEEVQWMLTHADLIGALRAEGHALWQPVWAEQAMIEQQRDTLTANQCYVDMRAGCAENTAALTHANTKLVVATQKVAVWSRLLDMDTSLSLLEWWNVTSDYDITAYIHSFATALSTLHNITAPSDKRVKNLRLNATIIAAEIGSGWRDPIVRSLLLRDLWSTCLAHIHRRESRVQEMMVATGVQELYNTHERLLIASLRSINSADAPIVQGWFDTIGNYAWWLSEDVPTIVRRCIGQAVGECRRIGITEITSLMAQFDEQSRILKDWSRCLFIGMWNAMPAVGLLFVVEIIVLLIPQRHIHTVIMDDSLKLLQDTTIFTKHSRLLQDHN